MLTEYRFSILLYLFRQKAGQVRHVPKENLCCTSVLSDSQAVRRSENLAPLGTTRSASVFSMGSCPAQPIFSLNRVHELPNYFSQYMLVVTNKYYDKLKSLFTN